MAKIKEDFKLAKVGKKLTAGATIRTAREIHELSQSELAEMTGIAQEAISAIEGDKITLGVDRAKKLAVALEIHPAVILFSNWDDEKKELKKLMNA